MVDTKFPLLDGADDYADPPFLPAYRGRKTLAERFAEDPDWWRPERVLAERWASMTPEEQARAEALDKRRRELTSRYPIDYAEYKRKCKEIEGYDPFDF
jgi:hypothetical protein